MKIKRISEIYLNRALISDQRTIQVLKNRVPKISERETWQILKRSEARRENNILLYIDIYSGYSAAIDLYALWRNSNDGNIPSQEIVRSRISIVMVHLMLAPNV